MIVCLEFQHLRGRGRRFSVCSRQPGLRSKFWVSQLHRETLYHPLPLGHCHEMVWRMPGPVVLPSKALSTKYRTFVCNPRMEVSEGPQSFPGLLFGQGEAPYNSLQNKHWAFLLFSRSPGPPRGSIHWEYTLPCLSIQGTRENDDVVSEDLVQQDVQVSDVDGGLYSSVRSLMEGERSWALGWSKGEVFCIKHQKSLNHSLFFIEFHQKKTCRFISEVACSMSCMNEVREYVEVK